MLRKRELKKSIKNNKILKILPTLLRIIILSEKSFMNDTQSVHKLVNIFQHNVILIFYVTNKRVIIKINRKI